MGQASIIRRTSDHIGMEHPTRTVWALPPRGVLEAGGASQSAWATATVTDILIIITRGGDPGATMGPAVGGQRGAMAGVDMPILMCTVVGETRRMPIRRQRGLILTPETTEPPAGQHFTMRNAVRSVSPAAEVTRTSTRGTRSPDVEPSPMTRKRGL